MKKNQSIKIVILLASFLLYLGCKKKSLIDIKEYYFPLESLKNEMNYIYIVKNNELTDSLIWKFEREIVNDINFINSTSTLNGCILSKNKEKITKKKSIYYESFLFTCIDKDKFKAEIDETNNILFPFFIDKDLDYRMELSYRIPEDNIINSITKTRKFSEFTTVNFKNNSIDCIVLEGKESYSDHSSSITFEVREYFGLGLGLIKSEKHNGDSSIITTLIEITK